MPKSCHDPRQLKIYVGVAWPCLPQVHKMNARFVFPARLHQSESQSQPESIVVPGICKSRLELVHRLRRRASLEIAISTSEPALCELLLSRFKAAGDGAGNNESDYQQKDEDEEYAFGRARYPVHVSSTRRTCRT